MLGTVYEMHHPLLPPLHSSCLAKYPSKYELLSVLLPLHVSQRAKRKNTIVIINKIHF